nr:hypothetical protein [Veillonella denticariosi]
MDDSTPKYLNSPESPPIFEKGKILFAFDKAYKSIRQEKQAILVEGYMDVISAHNQGGDECGGLFRYRIYQGSRTYPDASGR